MEKEGLIAPNSLFTLSPKNTSEKVRLDRYLTAQFPLYSRSFFKKLIDEGFIKVNDKTTNKQSLLLESSDLVTIKFPGERVVSSATIEERKINVDIVAEHDHFYIINKPAGLIVHPPKTNSGMVTLMDWLVHHHNELQEVGYVDRPGIVHRLDKDTSGLMIIPRTNYAHKTFSDMFKDRQMHKTYHAVVHGHPEKEGIIELPIGRHPIQRMKMCAFSHPDDLEDPSKVKGREATTYYRVLEYYKESALIEAKPVTGRTHQIRVHCAAIGHPIIGDPVYGMSSKKIKRHALHAAGIAFTFLEKEHQYTITLPHDMHALIALEKTTP